MALDLFSLEGRTALVTGGSRGIGKMIARGFIDINRLVNVTFFWMDVSNPFPWVSGSWPVTGPTAFTGRAPDRVGVSVTVRTP